MTNETITYKTFKIEKNQYGFFNVRTINCFASPTIESAKKAIDSYIADREFRKAFTVNRHGEYQ
jgi:hypothetical protein